MIRILAISVLLSVLSNIFPAIAQEATTDAIRCRLDPKCAKPGFRSLPFGSRGVAISGEAADPPNSINFHITFDFGSAILLNDSLITLDALGAALVDPTLRSSSFMIAGHTDARGTEQYNQRLSERRAASVAGYLSAKFHIDPARFTVKGFGKQQLFDPSHPEDQVNRRVQVVNLSANAQ